MNRRIAHALSHPKIAKGNWVSSFTISTTFLYCLGKKKYQPWNRAMSYFLSISRILS